MSVSNTLPPVRLNNQAYQKVTSTVVTMSGRLRSNCGMKTNGRCQAVISSPSRAADASGDHFDCSLGCAKPRQPGSSPKGPSRGFTIPRPTSSSTVYHGWNWANEGAGAPAAMFRPIPTAWTSNGRPIAAAYQIQFTRQRMMRRPSRASPGKPSATRTTTIADTSGEKARKVPNGSVDQAIRYVRAKKITSSRRRTKARNPFVGAVAELPVTSTFWTVGVPDAPSEVGSFGSFCTMRVFMPAPRLVDLFYKLPLAAAIRQTTDQSAGRRFSGESVTGPVIRLAELS